MKRLLLVLLLTACVSSNDSNVPSQSEILGHYNMSLTKAGGTCNISNTNSEVTIEDDGGGDVTLVLDGVRNICLGQYSNGELSSRCDVPLRYFGWIYDFQTIQMNWKFEQNSFSGTTVVTTNLCYVRLNTEGFKN